MRGESLEYLNAYPEPGEHANRALAIMAAARHLEKSMADAGEELATVSLKEQSVEEVNHA
jgi:hypothetical protein